MIKFQLSCLLVFAVIVSSGCASYSGPRFKTLKTWKEMQEQNVVMQQLDFSCGIASLATLMNYYFGDDVTETMLIKEVLDSLSESDKADRQEKGLSLLDLKRLAERRGYKAYAVTLKPSYLYKIDRPISVYLETGEFRHFAVFRGIKEDRIFLSDPSRGNTRMPVENFLKTWRKGIALVLDKKGFEPSANHLLSIKEFFRPERAAARNFLFFKP